MTTTSRIDKLLARALLAGLLVGACSNASTSATTTTGASSTARTTGPASTVSSQPGATTTTAPALPTWYTFGGAADRRSHAAAGPDPATIAKHWTSPPLDGLVYAQPLVAGSFVIAATEGNSVYALAADTGAVVWRTNLGDPVPGSSLPCGNIDPSGITGTPVIDPISLTLYVVAFTKPAEHHLVAVSVATGEVKWRRPIDPPGLSPKVEQQRSALTVANGRVYVAFGGLYGDCGNYKGAVVSSALDGTAGLQSWIVPTQREAGIWAPAGPAVDEHGDLYVATGNGESSNPKNFDYGNTVARLRPDLTLADWWAPRNWASLSASDTDLGSQSPVLLDNGHVFVAGKSGQGFVLNRSALGNVGGQISATQACDGGAFGGSATDGSLVVIGCNGGSAAVAVDPAGMISLRWRQAASRPGMPVIAGQVAWMAYSDGHLRALDTATGKVIADQVVADHLAGFPSPSVTSGAIYIGGTDRITSFA